MSKIADGWAQHRPPHPTASVHSHAGTIPRVATLDLHHERLDRMSLGLASDARDANPGFRADRRAFGDTVLGFAEDLEVR